MADLGLAGNGVIESLALVVSPSPLCQATFDQVPALHHHPRPTADSKGTTDVGDGAAMPYR